MDCTIYEAKAKQVMLRRGWNFIFSLKMFGSCVKRINQSSGRNIIVMVHWRKIITSCLLVHIGKTHLHSAL